MNKETIEEAAEKFAKDHSIYPTAQDDTEYGFKHGAMWMEEQMEKLKDFDTWKEWFEHIADEYKPDRIKYRESKLKKLGI